MGGIQTISEEKDSRLLKSLASDMYIFMFLSQCQH